MTTNNQGWQGGDSTEATWQQQQEVIQELPPTPKGPEHKIDEASSKSIVYPYTRARANQREIVNQNTYINQVTTVKPASPNGSYEYIQNEKNEEHCSNIYSPPTPQWSNQKSIINHDYCIWLQNELLNSQKQQIHLLELWKDKSSNFTQGRMVKQQQQFDHKDPQGYHYKLQRWMQEQINSDQQEDQQNSFQWFFKNVLEKDNVKRRQNPCIWQPQF